MKHFSINNYFNIFLRPKKRRKIVKKTNTRYLKNKERARELVAERLLYWNESYKFKYKRVFIKNQKTRWGSCSKNGNLNFSYKILFLPDRLIDYIIVHELCHLGEFNHSKDFWALVEKTIVNYVELKNELKTHGAIYVSPKIQNKY